MINKTLLSLIIVIIGAAFLSCEPYLQGSPLPSPTIEGLEGQLAFVHSCCGCTKTDTVLVYLPDVKKSMLGAITQNARQLAWSPDGQLLGFVSRQNKGIPILQVVDIESKNVQIEIAKNIHQFAWSPNGEYIFYRDDKEDLYRYNLITKDDEYLTNGVSYFSVSPNGRWLGLSQRETRENLATFGYFTLRVIDLEDCHILRPSNEGLIERLGSNRSAWNPVGNEMAVVFGTGPAQASQIVIYTVKQNVLEIKHSIIAKETYIQDYGKDEKVDFADIEWSPNGEKLLVRRTTSEGMGEAILFNTILSEYERLPLGQNLVTFSWMDSDSLIYTTSSEKNAYQNCSHPLQGGIWVANLKTLKTQSLTTETLFIEKPAWHP